MVSDQGVGFDIAGCVTGNVKCTCSEVRIEVAIAKRSNSIGNGWQRVAALALGPSIVKYARRI